jgi:hypothetical protein
MSTDHSENVTSVALRALTPCSDCGLTRHHTYRQCTEIRIARARLEEAGWWHIRFAAHAAYGCCERIAEAERQLKIAESLGQQ